MNSLNELDKECTQIAIETAKKALQGGNYPVGAVLVINGEIIGSAGNEIYTKKSYVDHAENSLIIKHGNKLAVAKKDPSQMVSLYSTLEPCIQCLGAAVTNHVDRIVYIQKDPNGGACDLNHDNIGAWYQEFWPEIIHAPISNEPKEMMIKFFRDQIKSGNKKWPEKMLKLLGVK